MISNLFFFNRCFDKNRLKAIISWSLTHCGEKATIELVENLKDLGFQYATQAGISLGLDDLKTSPTKPWLVSQAEIQIHSTQLDYQKGDLTAVEKFQQLIDTWHRTSETLKQNVVQHFRSTDILNPVYMMAFSGARGNISQVRQLVGMRGLMADPQGQIIDFPIQSNFREGLTLTEYVISCYGARKGLVDTALRTANSGYLTRRLVDVSQHVIVSQLDCKTRRGIYLNEMKEGQKTILSLQNRLLGRVLAENLDLSIDSENKYVFSERKKSIDSKRVDPFPLGPLAVSHKVREAQEQKEQLPSSPVYKTNEFFLGSSGEAIFFHEHKKQEEYLDLKSFKSSNTSNFIAKNEEISSNLAAKIVKLKKKVLVRSALTCESKNSICQLCYGWSLAHGNLVSLGEAVGILAAQSIGEPGTQLTMRTFHTGGVFSGDVMDEIRAPFDGIVEYGEALQGTLIRTPHGKIAFLTKVEGEVLVKSNLPQFKNPVKHQQQFLLNDSKNTTRVAPFTLAQKQDAQKAFFAKKTFNKNKIIKFRIPSSTILFVREGEFILEKQLIAEFSSMSMQTNQRIQAKHNLNSEIEGQVFFENVFLGVKIGKEGDITRTANKLGSIWILAGKLFQSMVPSVFFPKTGDLLDTKSIINQSIVFVPSNGFLDSNRVLVQEETTLKTKKIYSNSWKKSLQEYSSKEEFVNDVFFNYPLFSLALKTIRYKKYGYFLSSCFSKQGSLSGILGPLYNEKTNKYKPIFNKVQIFSKYDDFYLSNSIEQEFKDLNQMKQFLYLQWFPEKYRTQTGGLIIFDKTYLNENLTEGQFFWVAQENYKFNLQKIFFTRNLNSKRKLYISNEIQPGLEKLFFSKPKKFMNKWIKKNVPTLSKLNFQGKPARFYTNFNGWAQIINSDAALLETSLVKSVDFLSLELLKKSNPYLSINLAGFPLGPLVFAQEQKEQLSSGARTLFESSSQLFKSQDSLDSLDLKEMVYFFKTPLDFFLLKKNRNKASVLLNDIPISLKKISSLFFKRKELVTEINLSSKKMRKPEKYPFEPFTLALPSQSNVLRYWRERGEELRIFSRTEKSSEFFYKIKDKQAVLIDKKPISKSSWTRTLFESNPMNLNWFLNSKNLDQGPSTPLGREFYSSQVNSFLDEHYNQFNAFRKKQENTSKVYCQNPGIVLNLEKSLMFDLKKSKQKEKKSKFYKKLFFYFINSTTKLRKTFFDQTVVSSKKIVWRKTNSVGFFPLACFSYFKTKQGAAFEENQNSFAEKDYSGSQKSNETSFFFNKINSLKNKLYFQKQNLLLGNSTILLNSQVPFTQTQISFNLKIFFTLSEQFPLGKFRTPLKSTLKIESTSNHNILSSKLLLDEVKKVKLSSLNSYAFKSLAYFQTEKFLKTKQNLFINSRPLKSITSKNICDNFLHKTKDNIKLTIKPGWMYFPKNKKQAIKNNQFLCRPGYHYLDDIIFDQHMIYVECLLITNRQFKSFKKLNEKFRKHIKNLELKENLDFCKIYKNPETISSNRIVNANLAVPSFDRHGSGVRDFVREMGELSKRQKQKEQLYSNQLKTLSEFLQTLPRHYIIRSDKTKVSKLNNFSIIFFHNQFINIGKKQDLNASKINFIVNSKNRFYKLINLVFQKKNEVREKNNSSNFLQNKNQVKSNDLRSKYLFSESNEFDSNRVAPFALAQKQEAQEDLLVSSKIPNRVINFLFSSKTRNLNQKKYPFSFINKDNLIFLSKVHKNYIENEFVNKKISNFVVYSSCLTRKSFKPKFLILIRKANQYPLINSYQNKKLFLQTKVQDLNFRYDNLKITSVPWFNKQKITKLISRFPAIDFQIHSFFRFKTSLISLGSNVNNRVFSIKKKHCLKEINLLEIFISLVIPTKHPLKLTKIQLISQKSFPLGRELSSSQKHKISNFLQNKNQVKSSRFDSSRVAPFALAQKQEVQDSNRVTPFALAQKQKAQKDNIFNIHVFNPSICFSAFRKLELSSFMNSEVKNKKNPSNVILDKKGIKSTKLLLYSNNWTFKKNPVSLTSFFSPYKGEITNVKTDLFGKQSCLFLSNKDIVTFSTQQKIPCVYVGKLIRQGDQIINNIGATSSGQIIQIDNTKLVLRKAQPILFSSRGVFHVYHGDFVEKNSPLLTLFFQRLKTGDIVQGIPKIEQFFEARQTKEGEILPENLHDRLHEFFENYKQHLSPQEASRKALEKIQRILVDGVQKVYQSQGVTIAEKHLEVIVRQMTSKVRIIDGGQTGLLRGELIDLDWIEVVNKGIKLQKAEYEPIILGITKAALETESFISASSFQETTRILARAAVQRKTDFLKGLKENVILGHLIPAGTGFSLSFDPETLKYSQKKKIENDRFFTNIFRNLDIQNKKNSNLSW